MPLPSTNYGFIKTIKPQKSVIVNNNSMQEVTKYSIDEQRKNTQPDIDRTDVVFADSGLSYSESSPYYDYSKPFSEQVDDYLAGNIPKNDTLVLGGTAEVFQKVGFNALPVTINRTHIEYALHGTKDADHFLGEAKLKQLPEKLKRPIAIIKSETQGENRVVALLDFSQNGKTVIVPVEIDGFGTQNNNRVDSNAVVSVFGKTNAITKLLFDAVNSEVNNNFSIFYWNKKEAISLLQAQGLQLPNHLPQDGFINSIRNKNANVNIRFKSQTETQQFRRWFGDWMNKKRDASKVVDENGKPLIVYHGTNASDITVFDKSKYNANEASGDYVGEGFFFAKSKYTAQKYGKNIMPVYLNIRNPLVINSAEDAKKFRNSFLEMYSNGDKELRNLIGGDYDYFSLIDENQSLIREELEKRGYDGLIDNMYGQYAVFDSTQIKSATDNIGAFDGNNPDIRYQQRNSGEIESSKPYNIDPSTLDEKELKVYNNRGWSNSLFTKEDRLLLQKAFEQLNGSLRTDNVLGDGTRIADINNKIVLIGGTFNKC